MNHVAAAREGRCRGLRPRLARARTRSTPGHEEGVHIRGEESHTRFQHNDECRALGRNSSSDAIGVGRFRMGELTTARLGGCDLLTIEGETSFLNI
eukprot:8791128-Pyramimonas_sp.AAC.1